MGGSRGDRSIGNRARARRGRGRSSGDCCVRHSSQSTGNGDPFLRHNYMSEVRKMSIGSNLDSPNVMWSRGYNWEREETNKTRREGAKSVKRKNDRKRDGRFGNAGGYKRLQIRWKTGMKPQKIKWDTLRRRDSGGRARAWSYHIACTTARVVPGEGSRLSGECAVALPGRDASHPSLAHNLQIRRWNKGMERRWFKFE